MPTHELSCVFLGPDDIFICYVSYQNNVKLWFKKKSTLKDLSKCRKIYMRQSANINNDTCSSPVLAWKTSSYSHHQNFKTIYRMNALLHFSRVLLNATEGVKCSISISLFFFQHIVTVIIVWIKYRLKLIDQSRSICFRSRYRFLWEANSINIMQYRQGNWKL